MERSKPTSTSTANPEATSIGHPFVTILTYAIGGPKHELSFRIHHSPGE